MIINNFNGEFLSIMNDNDEYYNICNLPKYSKICSMKGEKMDHQWSQYMNRNFGKKKKKKKKKKKSYSLMWRVNDMWDFQSSILYPNN